MRADDIPDTEINAADPETLIKQYEPWITRQAKRYIPILERSGGSVGIEDLEQAGRIAILQAQQKYDCSAGASFLTYSTYYIRKCMRAVLGFNSNTGQLPPTMVYLDAPIDSETGEGDSIIDLIPDPSIPDNAERFAEEAEQQEISEAVHNAIQRLKSEKQREIITRRYLEGEQPKVIAEAMGIKTSAVHAARHDALNKLRRNPQLSRLAKDKYPHHVTLAGFRRTWSSEQELAILREESEYDEKHGLGAFAEKIRELQKQRREEEC